MHGVFDGQTDDLFTHYACTLKIRDRLLGGVPSDAHLIEAWLMRHMGVTRQEEVQQLTVQTLKDIGVDTDELFGGNNEKTFKTLREAAVAIAGKSQTTVFKRTPASLYIESRQVKAMLRESCNILWPSNRGTNKWGTSRARAKDGAETTVGGKAPKSYLIESISIEPLRIPLGVAEPTGIDLAVQHIIDRNGPRSALSYYEYVTECEISFVVRVLNDQIPREIWPPLWSYAEQHGLGAKRSQDFGRFKVLRWEPISADEARRLMDPDAPPTSGTSVERLAKSGRLARAMAGVATLFAAVSVLHA